jgi:chaperonin cofactor prefoldin
MIQTNWFQRKWGLDDPVLVDELYQRLVDLEQRVKVLEEENVELTNELYRMENSLDARIDILTEHYGTDYNV